MQSKKPVKYFVILLLIVSIISQIYLINDSLQSSDEINSSEDINENYDIVTPGQTISDPIVRYPEHNQVKPDPIKLNDTRDNNIDFFQSPNQNQLSMNSIDNYKVADNSIYSNWQSGQSVRVDNIFNSEVTNAYRETSDHSVYGTSISEDVYYQNYYGSYESDGTEFIISMHDTTESSSITDFFVVEIEYEYINSYNIHVIADIDYTEATGTWGSLANIYLTPYRNGITVTSKTLSWGGTSGSTSVDDYITLDSSYADGNKLLFLLEVWWTTSSTNVEHIHNIRFDKFAVEETVTSNTKSEYIYTSSSTIQNKLTIENFDYGNKLVIYKPENWDYSSISTSATVAEISGNIEITGTIPVTYTVLFSQTNYYFMAAEDITDFETSCMDFECGSNRLINRINNAGNNGLESQEIVTDIVSQGSYALKVYDNAWGQTSFPIDDMEEGFYFFAYDIYLESGAGTWSFRGTSSSRTVSDYLTGRWYTFIEKMTIDYSIKYSTMPESSFIALTLDPTTTITAYIDNIHFWRASGKEIVESYTETKFISQWVSLDNIEDPLLIDEEVHLTVREREDKTNIITETIRTDDNGIATIIGTADFARIEYEILWVDSKSQFSYVSDTNNNPDTYLDLTKWSCNSGCTSYTESNNLNDKIVSLSYTGTASDQYIEYGPDFSVKDWDFISFEYATTDASYQLEKLYTYDTPYTGAYMGNQMDINGVNNRRYEILEPITDFSSYATYRDNNYVAAYMRFHFSSMDVAALTITIYRANYISAQKTYFTPIHSTGNVFSPEKKLTGENNYFDFSETQTGDGDLWGYYDKGVIDGSWRREYSGDYFYTYFPYKQNTYAFEETVSYDFTGYDYIDVRLYIDQVPNTENSYTMYWNWDRTDFWGNVASTNLVSDKTGWFELRFPIHTTFKNSHADNLEIMRITVSSNGVSDFTSVDFRIDYIIPIDEETYDVDWLQDSSQGFSWEFENDETVSSFWQSPATTQYGYASSFSSSNYGGMNSLTYAFENYFTTIPDVDRMEVKFRSTITGSYRLQWNLDTGSDIVTFDYITANEWQIVSRDMIGIVGDTLTGGSPLQIIGNNLAGDKYVDIEYIRFIKDEQPFLYETDNYFLFSSTKDTQIYYYELDGYGAYVNDLDIINKDMTVGSHIFNFVVIYDTFSERDFSQTSSVWYTYSYTIAEDGLSTISIVDQQSNFIDPRTFKIEIDSQRIYGDTFYMSDISSVFNLTISDFWGNVLYQNVAETYSRFVDLVLTLYSVKIYNEMQNPVHVSLTNGPTFSEWILPGEIIEYKLRADSYNFTLQYSNVASGFSAATLNGTTAEYIFSVNSDTALIINEFSIADVYNNVISLINDLDATNSSIQAAIINQTNNITISIDNTNTNINNQTNNIIIEITNTNSTLGSQLNTITTDISNLQTNVTLQINQISSNIANLQTNITIQYNDLNQVVVNVQTNQTLQYNSLTSLVNNFESSMDSQLNYISLNITNNLTNITLQFNDISTEINNVNSSIATQFNDITVLLNNLNSQIDSQINNLTIQITNSLINITGQINNIDISISNVNSEVISQANSINSNISNVNATLYLQSIDILNQINNNNSTIYNQTISILSAISNTNSTLYSQTLSILTQIDLSNSTQVALLLSNQNEIFEAQVIAAEYMSELRVERSDLLPSGNYVSMAIQTNWRNATVKIYVNGSLQYDGLESDAIVLQLIGSGSFNITTVISNYTWTNWVVISPTADTLIHYVLTNEAGVGLKPNIAKIVINGTTIYTLDQYYSSGTFLNITVYSWSNDLLYVTNTTVSGSEQEVVLVIPIFGQEFRNDYNFDVLLELTSITNTNYTISKVIPANSSIIIEMFESTFTTIFSPIVSAPINNGTHIITYNEFEQVVEFRKSLKAVRVDLSLSAISLQVEELTWFEKNVLPPMIAIFGVTGGVGLLVAIVLLALRSFGINLFRENILEKPVQRFGEETGFFTMSDDEDLSFNTGKKKRKIKYKNKYI